MATQSIHSSPVSDVVEAVSHGGGHGAEMAHGLPEMIFGVSPMIVATTILVIAYVFITSEKINRALVSLIGAGAMIFLGVLNQHLAVQGIDFNTIFLLIGMMTIVNVTKDTGVFQFVAIYAAKSVRGNPRALMPVLAIITAVFSALLDNVTTVLLIVPVTLLLCEQLKQKPYPFLFSQIFASNVGGMATLIGDPPNILIGSAVGLSFMDFVVTVGPVALVLMIILLGFFDVVWGRKMKTSLRAIAHLLKYDAVSAIKDSGLLIKCGIVLFAVLMGFIFGHGQGLEPGSVALTGAAVLLLLKVWRLEAEKQAHSVQEAFAEVEWETIFFFMGLFILVYGVEVTGLLEYLGQEMLSVTGGDMTATAMGILWVSAVLSAILDNIPFVATMIPLIESLGPEMGGEEALMPLWWCLALGACLGGNGSLIGASANVMVASFAERAGHRISFMQYMLLGFPLMIGTIAVAMGYVLLFIL